MEDGFILVFIEVYGPLSKEGQSSMWEDMGAISGLWGDPWCIGDDFNVIIFPS